MYQFPRNSYYSRNLLLLPLFLDKVPSYCIPQIDRRKYKETTTIVIRSRLYLMVIKIIIIIHFNQIWMKCVRREIPKEASTKKKDTWRSRSSTGDKYRRERKVKKKHHQDSLTQTGLAWQLQSVWLSRMTDWIGNGIMLWTIFSRVRARKPIDHPIYTN